MDELGLISFDDIVEEIEKRCDGFVIAYCHIREGNKKTISTNYCEKTDMHELIGLCSILEHDLNMNNDKSNLLEDDDGVQG